MAKSSGSPSVIVSVLAMVLFSPTTNIAGPNGIQMATEDRVQLSGWWPTKGTASRNDFLGPEACGRCHWEIAKGQQQTPMLNAAMHAAYSRVLRSHDRLTFSLPPYTYHIVRRGHGSVYSVTNGTKTIS